MSDLAATHVPYECIGSVLRLDVPASAVMGLAAAGGVFAAAALFPALGLIGLAAGAATGISGVLAVRKARETSEDMQARSHDGAACIALLRDLRGRLPNGAFASRHGSQWIVFETKGQEVRNMTAAEYQEFRLLAPLVNEVVVRGGTLTLRRLWGGAPDSAHTGGPAVLEYDIASRRLKNSTWYAHGASTTPESGARAHMAFLIHHAVEGTPFDGNLG